MDVRLPNSPKPLHWMKELVLDNAVNALRTWTEIPEDEWYFIHNNSDRLDDRCEEYAAASWAEEIMWYHDTYPGFSACIEHERRKR